MMSIWWQFQVIAADGEMRASKALRLFIDNRHITLYKLENLTPLLVFNTVIYRENYAWFATKCVIAVKYVKSQYMSLSSEQKLRLVFKPAPQPPRLHKILTAPNGNDGNNWNDGSEVFGRIRITFVRAKELCRLSNDDDGWIIKYSSIATPQKYLCSSKHHI